MLREHLAAAVVVLMVAGWVGAAEKGAEVIGKLKPVFDYPVRDTCVCLVVTVQSQLLDFDGGGGR